MKVVCVSNIMLSGALVEDLVIGDIYKVETISTFGKVDWYWLDISFNKNNSDVVGLPSSLFIDLDTHRQRLIDSILK